jgi:predicted Holliday junction resolvase-like endonuclease
LTHFNSLNSSHSVKKKKISDDGKHKVGSEKVNETDQSKKQKTDSSSNSITSTTTASAVQNSTNIIDIKVTTPIAPAIAGLSGLVDYGSDSD